MPDECLEWTQNVIERDLNPAAPNRLWVSDVTNFRRLVGFVYAAFVIYAFSKRIVG